MDIILNVENLKFSWPDSAELLLDIESFKVRKGEKIFLHGPSGSGKSTFLNLIAGVLTPQSGKIRILNKELTEWDQQARDQFRGDHMGFIFQMFNLLPYFSAMDNVTIACEFSKIKLGRVLQVSSSLNAEAERLLQELKLNPNILKNKKIVQLSVGQQQRVATARALMGRPEIIIADEPTSALDANIRSSFLKLLFQECEKFGTTLIFVSHDLSLAKDFDQKYLLSEINKANTLEPMEKELI